MSQTSAVLLSLVAAPPSDLATDVLVTFVPEGAGPDARLDPATGGALASLLTYYEIDPGVVRFLGSLQWDDASLATEPSVQGGWFPAPPAAAHQDFEARYGKRKK